MVEQTLENFDNFMLHNDEIEFVSQGFSVDFGGGYSFATDGQFPVLRNFTLYFTGYKWYTKEENNREVIDTETNININNLGALREFYKRHLTSKSFIYNHPTEGPMKVRFKEPLNLPKRLKGAGGVCEDFTIRLKQVF